MADFKQIKNAVGCLRLLQDLGCEPMRNGAGYATFKSPLREGDDHPSFSVTSNGRWRDHATGAGGDVIDLVVALGFADNVKAAAEWLEKRYLLTGNAPAAVSHADKATCPVNRIEKVGPIESTALKEYLWSRGISETVAERFCRQVSYVNEATGRKFFGIGLRNENGGYAIRSSIAKVAIAPNGYTFVKQGNPFAVEVYEGMFDLMSRVQDKGMPSEDIVVLNSTANLRAAIPLLRDYLFISSYLDCDSAGRAALAEIKDRCKEVIVTDKSLEYAGYKDYNEYWIDKHSKDW